MSNTTVATDAVIVNRVVLPAGLAALKGKKVALFASLPIMWQRALWVKPQRIVRPDDILDEETFYDILAMTDSVEKNQILLEQEASVTIAADEETIAVGWHVVGPGNLTGIMLDWAKAIAQQIKAGDAVGALSSLGGKRAHDPRGSKGTGTRLRHVDALRLLRELPVRHWGSVNGVPVDRATLAGLALVGVALSNLSKRVQDLLCTSPEEEEAEVDGVNRAGGWPQFFTPEQSYGVLGHFAANNLKRFVGHFELRFKQGAIPDLQVLGATASLKALAIEADLTAGRMHIPHDQFKNSSTGDGTRGCWLKDGHVLSLPGAGSKPEKFLNRNKLVTGTGAIVANPSDSALRLQTEKGDLPITQGVRVPVLLTNWSLHGSGQVFSRPDVSLTASVLERHPLQLSQLEWDSVKGTLPKPGDVFDAGESVLPDLLEVSGDYPIIIRTIEHRINPYSGDMDVTVCWERIVSNYNGFKVKSLGLKGSIMPLIRGSADQTDVWSLFPGAEYLVNLEAAKGQAITLSMWAEARGGLTVTADDLSESEMAEYQAWMAANTVWTTVQHAIHECLVPAYREAGHTVTKIGSCWHVAQQAEFIQGHLVMEVEAPLVPCRQTRGSLSLMQAVIMASEVEATI